MAGRIDHFLTMVAHLLLVPNHGDHSIRDEEPEKRDGDDEDDILNSLDVDVFHNLLHYFHQRHRLLLLVRIAMKMAGDRFDYWIGISRLLQLQRLLLKDLLVMVVEQMILSHPQEDKYH